MTVANYINKSSPIFSALYIQVALAKKSLSILYETSQSWRGASQTLHMATNL
jgi:hypothetical protein